MGRKRKFPKHRQKTPKWFQRENQWGDFVFDWTFGLSGETRRVILGIVILLLAVITLLGFFGSAGAMGNSVSDFARKLFGGLGAIIFAISILYLGIILIIPPKSKKEEHASYRVSKFIGLFLFIIAVPTLLHLFIAPENAEEFANYGKGGGLAGFLISNLLRGGIGLFPAFLFSMFLIAISLLMLFDFSLLKYLGLSQSEEEEDDEKGKVNINGSRVSVFESIKRRMSGFKNKNKESDTKAEVIEVDTSSIANIRRDSTWEYPSLDILKDSDEAPNPGNINKNVEIIQKCLKTFGVEIVMSDVNVGPTVSQYTFKPEDGVKLNQIIARQTDLALALSAKSLRIEAPIPGKSSVGVEIPNKIPAKVTLKEILKEKEFRALKSKLAIALGRDVSGDPMAIDLEKMPHLLIAGATGSGKSVCINSLICSLLFDNSPNDLKLLLVDPKRVELTNYNGIPHLLTPVITEVDKTVSALKWTVWEMERRYKMFSDQGKRNIVAYNSSPGPEGKLPYIVIIIDELADLMATSAKEVEGSIVRLAQMARATGMHLVIATQRPSVDVLTGLIKANITSRIAFATASQVDSRTILDLSGAEKLLGNGDMLFIGNGVNKPKRVQGCFISDEEIEILNKFLRDKGEAEYDDAILSFRASHSGGALGSGDGSFDDDLYNDAVETVINAGKASASLLQRRLRVGYARAARLLDILEQQGVIGPADGAKPRDVLVTDTGSEAFQNSRGSSDFNSGSRDDNHNDFN